MTKATSRQSVTFPEGIPKPLLNFPDLGKTAGNHI